MIQLQQDDELPSDNDFSEFLKSEDLKKEYRSEIEIINKKIKEEFDDVDSYTGLHKKHDGEIKNDRKHRNIVNACIYPFSQKGTILTNLGYHFIRTEPLLEKEVSDVDFVIESAKQQTAIFGEAKSSTTDPVKIISEMKKRKEIIDKHREYLCQTIIPNSNIFEFTLGTESMEARDLYSAIARNNEGFIIWYYGGNDEKQLSLYVPVDVNPEKRKQMMHKDNDLNKSLNHVPTSTRLKNFFPKSHPIARLSVLTWVDRDIESAETEYKDYFCFNDVLKIFKIELEDFPIDYVEKMAKRTLEYAVSIGFVKQIDADNYKIATSSFDPEARYQDLKDKWIAYSIKKEKERKLTDLRYKLQLKMKEKKQKMFPPLDSFKDQST